ncbi:hypothetical protein MHAS_01988 [Mycolicibacterium hassiacum DSM 44199]|nr:hypothetical protein MHAS_01988 [Mycolicibacterium hassiacum DSM 44199]
MLIMTTYWQLRGQAVVWPGVTKVSLMTAAQVQARRYPADMAAKGNWQRVIQDLNPDNHLLDVNQWRPGDASWTTVLHEAAKQGAPLDVVSWLINRGALRSQRDAEGKTPYDVAKLEGHAPELLDLLAPPPSPLSREQIDRLDSLLAKAIDWFLESPFEGQDLRELFRYPPGGCSPRSARPRTLDASTDLFGRTASRTSARLPGNARRVPELHARFSCRGTYLGFRDY